MNQIDWQVDDQILHFPASNGRALFFYLYPSRTCHLPRISLRKYVVSDELLRPIAKKPAEEIREFGLLKQLAKSTT